jgi:hypothetical protein
MYLQAFKEKSRHCCFPVAVPAYQDNEYVVSDMQFGETSYTAGDFYTSIGDMSRVAQVLDEGRFLNPWTQELLLTPVPRRRRKKLRCPRAFTSFYMSCNLGSLAMIMVNIFISNFPCISIFPLKS